MASESELRARIPWAALGIVVPTPGSVLPASLESISRSVDAYTTHYFFTVGQSPNFEQRPGVRYVDFRGVRALTEWAGRNQATVVGIEAGPSATPLHLTVHPTRAVYLLGDPEKGLEDLLEFCHCTMSIPTAVPLNLSVAAATVLYDRAAKAARATFDQMFGDHALEDIHNGVR